MNKIYPKIIEFIKTIFKIVTGFFVTLLGVCGWLLQNMIQIIVIGILVTVIGVTVVYTKVKPDLDHCREIAYDKLAQMERQDFQMLSDTKIYDKNGDLLGIINSGHYEYVPINEISMNLQNLYIAQEDRRFKTHTGVDWIATFRAGLALIKNKGEITQGGSTITQQVIKNTYLTQEKSFTRKITEILLAPEIEKAYSKADIMEFYCNSNFYGNNCYGVQAASRYYFGKEASELTVAEAAILVGLSNSPSAYDPVKHPEESKEKRNDVLLSAYEVGYLTESEYNKAVNTEISVLQERGESTNEKYQCSYAIHCAAIELMKLDDFKFQYLFEDEKDQSIYQEKYQEVYNQKVNDIRAGGYDIFTSLDNDMQKILQEEIDKTLSVSGELQKNGKYSLQGAGVIVDNQTGYITAIVGGRGEDDLFNRAYLSARQPGSTIKPLLDYAPAFDTGEYYPAKLVNDHKWEDGPSNSGNTYYGNITVREALNRSLNTVAWQILDDIGIENGMSYLEKMEFQKLSYIDNLVTSVSIGGFTNGTRVVDMAKGYSTLANNGVYNDNTCILSIEHEQNGALLKDRKPKTVQVYEPDTAFMITDVLKGTLNEPYGTGYGLALENNMAAAGKTGTTNLNKDTWFCGYTRYYTVSIWAGHDTPKAMPGIYGSTYAGKIWKNVMDRIHTDKEIWDWDLPATVQIRRYENLGIEDYISTSAELRAEVTLHEKEQERLESQIESALSVYETEVINNVEDTYVITKAYADIFSMITKLDAGTIRTQFMERLERKHKEFESVMKEMQETIRLYEKQQKEKATKELEKEKEQAKADRKAQEDQTKKNEFLNALQKVESLEYQASNAQKLIQDAIDKLDLVKDYQEAAAYSNRLDIAIRALKSRPTTSEWMRMESERIAREEEAAKLEAERVEREQEALNRLLIQESPKWDTSQPANVIQSTKPEGGN